MELVYRNEKTLKTILLVISLAAWLAILILSRGLVLIYVALFGLIYLFAQSAFIAHLRGTGVKVSAGQFTDIHARLQEAGKRLDLATLPDCYVLRMNVFNSLATRFLGRSYIVLFAEVVDELKNCPDALNFYIGHELGHLKRHHLSWHTILLPASFLPLIGAAYRRACEYTCDRHGLACCSSPEVAQRGLLAIAVRRSRLPLTSIPAYAAQTGDSGGFWMSYHELTADYPWLTKRVAAIDTLSGVPDATPVPRRHVGSWILAFFTFRIGMVAGGSGIMMIAIIGILAAIAIPAYQDYTLRAQVTAGLTGANQVKVAVTKYYASNGRWPADLAAFGVKQPLSGPYVEALWIEAGTIHVRFGGQANPLLAGKLLDLRPSLSATRNVLWTCGYAVDSGTDPESGGAARNATEVAVKYLPAACRTH